ncbi:peroxidase-related enzyme [Halomonas desiderata]|uniref:Peroxidase-related enzyme n=1 Tax=Billgrantia desiderata TaxID=52021 RepID=A0AAW4YZ04_9GAMM|nr:peroxidase-related enzyme [Halomonas desiderata]MCE8010750.1 peroxidase-related enzyme [Halomonas desiderata]MCE8042088.1 peroxidase-related enzyme [Halomonas desiderata]MCE8046767.1 peroxidase-related enzyme [Halomonas desiderata]MCE8053370.1 peroxidase-related enzyme [Halomonas desiderata]NIC36999.1 peroxidase-related enzyme [Halomonas desiderata]
MPAPLSRFPVPESIQDLPEDIRGSILAVQEKADFVPNVFLMLAHRPDEFRAFFAYHDALMERESDTLTKAEKEMIVVATSARNRCLYCVVAHGALVRIYSKDPLLADQVAINHRTAPISERHRVMLDFALHCGLDVGELTDEWQARLIEAGFTHDDIWDIGAIAAFFGLSNRLVTLTGTPPNPEFYLMGRVPREKPAAG